jgi:hypothetical protein
MGCLKMGSSFIAVLKTNMPAMASGTSKMYMFIGNMLNMIMMMNYWIFGAPCFQTNPYGWK